MMTQNYVVNSMNAAERHIKTFVWKDQKPFTRQHKNDVDIKKEQEISLKKKDIRPSETRRV